MSWIAHAICFTTVHGMGSGSALRLSGMTKLWGGVGLALSANNSLPLSLALHLTRQSGFASDTESIGRSNIII
jgi:hypothetical protein